MKNEENMQNFSARLIGCRNNKGLTQTEMANLLGVSLRSVQVWESGDYIPRPQQMRRISEIFGVPVSWLLNGDSPPGPGEGTGGAVTPSTARQLEEIAMMMSSIMNARQISALLGMINANTLLTEKAKVYWYGLLQPSLDKKMEQAEHEERKRQEAIQRGEPMPEALAAAELALHALIREGKIDPSNVPPKYRPSDKAASTSGKGGPRGSGAGESTSGRTAPQAQAPKKSAA